MLIKNDNSEEVAQQAEGGLPEGNLERDRHQERKPLFKNSGKGVFSRRYYLIAGSYLVVVLLLLALAFLKWGNLPFAMPEIPGLERKAELGFQGEVAGTKLPEQALSTEETGEETAGAGMPQAATEEGPAPGSANILENSSTDAFAALETAGEEITIVQPLSQAASPLPQWELYSPFGSYLAEKLPSGGNLHRLARGVYLQATPGAPVAALWDGIVRKVGIKGSLYNNSILIDHGSGQQTFYGNLQEVWVEEGRSVSRGENIGLLPHTLTVESPADVSLAEGPARPAEGEPVTEVPAIASGERTVQEKPGAGTVPIKDIWRGYYWEKAAIAPPGTADGPDGEVLPAVATPDPQNPLLYLEIRVGNNYLDPLKFINARN